MGKIILSGFADEYSSNFTEQLEGMRSFDIGYVEVRGVDGKNVSVLTKDEVKEVKRKLDFYGMGVSAIGSPIGKVKLDGDINGHFEMARRVFETAGELDAKHIRMFSFYAPEGKNILDYKESVYAYKRLFLKSTFTLYDNQKGKMVAQRGKNLSFFQLYHIPAKK